MVDLTTELLALLVAAGIGILSTLAILVRQRSEERAEAAESPFAASTEGETRCPKCGMGNLWTDVSCVSCGARLPMAAAGSRQATGRRVTCDSRGSPPRRAAQRCRAR